MSGYFLALLLVATAAGNKAGSTSGVCSDRSAGTFLFRLQHTQGGVVPAVTTRDVYEEGCIRYFIGGQHGDHGPSEKWCRWSRISEKEIADLKKWMRMPETKDGGERAWPLGEESFVEITFDSASSLFLVDGLSGPPRRLIESVDRVFARALAPRRYDPILRRQSP